MQPWCNKEFSERFSTAEELPSKHWLFLFPDHPHYCIKRDLQHDDAPIWTHPEFPNFKKLYKAVEGKGQEQQTIEEQNST